ncbi:CLUMA_CG007727, isoform A [Clunio marinus]|uniref:CLUMA_CG007727, isoform A n=1 Tax=Clunio marinus TaxID=568069 RepID=A0A1J1I3N8_9DIPT|nr:CLUMA_CG007727, isoform A [Clunio marinus]
MESDRDDDYINYDYNLNFYDDYVAPPPPKEYEHGEIPNIVKIFFFMLLFLYLFIIFYYAFIKKNKTSDNNDLQLSTDPFVGSRLSRSNRSEMRNNRQEVLMPVSSDVTIYAIEDDDLGFYTTINFDDIDPQIDQSRTRNLLPLLQQSSRRESQELPPNYEDPPSYDEIAHKVP